jgi:hypothetical protein
MPFLIIYLPPTPLQMKEFKVVPFTPTHNTKGHTTLNEVADQLDDYFTAAAREGWEYERIETIRSHVPSKGGCFGFFQEAAYDMSNHFIVFSRNK